MAKDEEPKPPPFQLFQQPFKKVEPPPSEKAKQPPPLFQQPPVFERAPPPPPPPVKPLPALEEKPRPVRDHTTIKPARTFNGLTARNKKILWIAVGALVVGLASYFIITSVLEKMDTPAATPLEKKETAPAPKPTLAPPSAKPTKGVVQTETGSKVNMRVSPSEDAQVVIQIPSRAEVVILRYGEEVEVKGEKGKWCRVAYRGEVGWVWGNFITKKLK